MRYWKRVDAQGRTTTVEWYDYDLDVEGAIEIDKAEYDAYIASLPPPPLPPKTELELKVESLEARVDKLEKAGAK